MPIAIGVDIGGSHISCAAVDMKTHKTLSKTYFKQEVNSKDSKENILKTWGNCINKTLASIVEETVEGISFAMPGPFKYKEGIAMFEINDKYEALYNVSVVEELPKYLSRQDLKLRFLNDASSFGLGSILTGGVSSDKKVIAVTLGTGFGAAFFDGMMPVLTGDRVPENGCLWDKEYKEGISDDYFSTRWFLSKYKDKFGVKTIHGVKSIIEENEDAAKEIFTEFSDNFYEYMLPYINNFTPDLLVIGGSIAKSSKLFLPRLEQLFENGETSLKIQIIDNTEVANIIGASYTLNDVFWNEIKTILPEI
ncbi:MULTISPECIES: ROK family protein [Galbibacter]|uniref:ROK family protein n=1 Tax=Galbibacter orientalis TaxID=453852 RepID=UPI003002819F